MKGIEVFGMRTGVDDNTLGEFVRAGRDAKRLSLAHAARLSGLDYKYWSKVESGGLQQPNPRYLTQIARTIDVSVDDLFGLVGYGVPERLPSFSPYLRTKYDLPPEAVADLERYFDMLRSYYDIPDEAPVFPPKPKAEPSSTPTPKPAADRRNSDAHPWRTT
jgi:transcriptional regulator with XRE-family HTH domain